VSVKRGLPYPRPQAESAKRQALPLVRRALRPNAGKRLRSLQGACRTISGYEVIVSVRRTQVARRHTVCQSPSGKMGE
jgi:hypothetical protein